MNKFFLTLLSMLALASCSRKPYLFSWENEPNQEEPLALVGDSQFSPVQQRVIYLPVQEDQTVVGQNIQQNEVKPEEVILKNKNPNRPYRNLTATDFRSKIKSSDIVVKQDANGVDIVLPAYFVFGTNQTTVQFLAERDLSYIADQIKENKRMMVQVRGYTDNNGSLLSNKELSFQRAKAVSDFLQLHGVDYKRIYIAGLGPQDPVASNETPEGRAQNNRIEIRLVGIQ